MAEPSSDANLSLCKVTMQLNTSSFILLKKLSARNRVQKNAGVIAKHQEPSREPKTKSKSHAQRFQDWISPKPKEIEAFPGEHEIFRKGLFLVTDTRIAYIDPLDRMLKTYMFEHMISLHKHFYRTTAFNRRLCKGLLILCILVFFVTLTIDLLDNKSSGFIFVYLLLFASILLGIKVWNDMKPWYVIHWRMSDHTYGEILQEPLLGERLTGDTSREVFMTELANAMNQALSAKAWWPASTQQASNNKTRETASTFNQTTTDKSASGSNDKSSTQLKLVTENYQ